MKADRLAAPTRLTASDRILLARPLESPRRVRCRRCWATAGLLLILAIVALGWPEARAASPARCAQYATGSLAHAACVEARRDCGLYTAGSRAYARCNAADPTRRRYPVSPRRPATAERPRAG